MRNPWVHDADDDTRPSESTSAGARDAVRLGVALWLLVGVAAVGLYLGWNVAPRGYDGGPPAADPGFVVESDADSLTVLLPVGGRHFGFAVDVATPRVEVVVAGNPVAVV